MGCQNKRGWGRIVTFAQVSKKYEESSDLIFKILSALKITHKSRQSFSSAGESKAIHKFSFIPRV